MKALFTFLLILFTGTASIAQNEPHNDKVEAFKNVVVTVDVQNDTNQSKKVTNDTENSIVRLYRYKNSRVKRELAFITKKNYVKLT